MEKDFLFRKGKIMEQKGKVVSVEKDIATVELMRESACSSCHHKDSCGAGVMAGCAKSESITIKANNLCNAEVGDSVILSSDSARTLGVAFCVFVLPLILTFAAYLICSAAGASVVVNAIVSAAVFFVSFFALFFGFNRILTGKININITAVVDE